MAFSSVLRALDLLDTATVTGEQVADAVRATGVKHVEVQRFTGVPGTEGDQQGDHRDQRSRCGGGMLSPCC